MHALAGHGRHALSAGLGGQRAQTVQQGQGATLTGTLSGAGGAVATRPLCVFSRVATDQAREFLGIALTDPAGGYRFPIPAGPSRDLSAIYRPGQRQLSGHRDPPDTVVHPTLAARTTVVHNKHWAHFEGEIPGPHNDQVVIVLQVKSGKGWLAFRRYRTRGGGHFEAAYRFRRTTRPTSYEMRAQVRETVGYPYLQGESDPLALRVVPGRAKAPARPHRARSAPKARLEGQAPQAPLPPFAPEAGLGAVGALVAGQRGHSGPSVARRAPGFAPGPSVEVL